MPCHAAWLLQCNAHQSAVRRDTQHHVQGAIAQHVRKGRTWHAPNAVETPSLKRASCCYAAPLGMAECTERASPLALARPLRLLRRLRPVDALSLVGPAVAAQEARSRASSSEPSRTGNPY
jgi:hypothetical protein